MRWVRSRGPRARPDLARSGQYSGGCSFWTRREYSFQREPGKHAREVDVEVADIKRVADSFAPDFSVTLLSVIYSLVCRKLVVVAQDYVVVTVVCCCCVLPVVAHFHVRAGIASVRVPRRGVWRRDKLAVRVRHVVSRRLEASCTRRRSERVLPGAAARLGERHWGRLA